jgi:hypothetical protein
MIQNEKGLKSGCVCPSCGYFCSSCMGSSEGPLTPSQLSELFESHDNVFDDEIPSEKDEDRSGREKTSGNWRKYL